MQHITIAGNIGKDAETRTTPKGDTVTGFTVAVSNRGDTAPSWYDVALWGQRGVKLGPHLTKGSKIVVCGTLGRREYEGKTYLTVRADEITLMGGGRDRGADSAPAGGFGNQMDDEIPFAPEWR